MNGHTRVATLQTMWDCRWSRAAAQLTGTGATAPPGAGWVCVRTAEVRAVDEQLCERCPHWQADDPDRG